MARIFLLMLISAFVLTSCVIRKEFYAPSVEPTKQLAQPLSKGARFAIISTLGNEAGVRKGQQYAVYEVPSLTFISHRLGQEAEKVLNNAGYKEVSLHYVPTVNPLSHTQSQGQLSAEGRTFIDENTHGQADYALVITPPLNWKDAFFVNCGQEEGNLYVGFTLYVINIKDHRITARYQANFHEPLRSFAACTVKDPAFRLKSAIYNAEDNAYTLLVKTLRQAFALTQ